MQKEQIKYEVMSYHSQMRQSELKSNMTPGLTDLANNTYHIMHLRNNRIIVTDSLFLTKQFVIQCNAYFELQM